MFEEDDPLENPDEQTSDTPDDDCLDTITHIYAIDEDQPDYLYGYDPENNIFELLGEIDCSPFGQPISLAVARNGYAYIQFSNQSMYRLDLRDFSCAESNYSAAGLGTFGLGFTSSSTQHWNETLFLSRSDQLMSVDVLTWQTQELGSMPSKSKLTGNSNGELWALLYEEDPMTLSRLNKTNAQIEAYISLSFTYSSNIDNITAEYWGGSFYV